MDQTTAPVDPGKAQLRAHFDRLAPRRDGWIARNRYFYETDYEYMRFLVGPKARVLELGCGTGSLLGALAPSRRGLDAAVLAAAARQAAPPGRGRGFTSWQRCCAVGRTTSTGR